MGGRGLNGCAVVVPAFNEVASIGRVVESLSAFGTVIIVDDASSDATAEEAQRAGAVVVRLSDNRGYGGAIDAGFREAAARGIRYAITCDADGQHEPKDVGAFARLLAGGEVDLAIGIRHGRRRLLERVCGWYARFAFGVCDPLCGLKGYDLRYFLAYGGFDLRHSVGTELMTYALRHGARWSQQSITVHERTDGSSRFYADVRGNLRILRSLWALLVVR